MKNYNERIKLARKIENFRDKDIRKWTNEPTGKFHMNLIKLTKTATCTWVGKVNRGFREPSWKDYLQLNPTEWDSAEAVVLALGVVKALSNVFLHQQSKWHLQEGLKHPAKWPLEQARLVPHGRGAGEGGGTMFQKWGDWKRNPNL